MKKGLNNKLSDLNNYLFEQIERLQDDDQTDEQLEKEIQRSKAVSGIAAQIVNNAKLALDAQKYYDGMGGTERVVNPLLEVNDEV